MRDFNHTVGKLVTAYINGTLKHGYCYACAVGNILGSDNWGFLFQTISSFHYPGAMPKHQNQLIAPPGFAISHTSFGKMIMPIEFLSCTTRRYVEKALDEVAESGYTINELARVENAFETVPFNLPEDDRMFAGLMAVVDVLADIHGMDLTATQNAKALFVKA